MAFIVITADTDEIEHRELTGPLTIGRSPDCDVSIRDVLLSRRHCRFEPADDEAEGWCVVDLESKNKTKVNGQPIDRHVLDDGDIVRVGKTRMMFNAGVFTAPSSDARRRRIRPADPHEALAGTVAGFELLEPGSTPRTDFFPTPQPSPRKPRAYEVENVESLVSGIASSSWDSIVTGAQTQTRTVRATPKPVMRRIDTMQATESDEQTDIETFSNRLPEFEVEPQRELTKMELAARQLQADATALDALAVDALAALSDAVAQVEASKQAAAESKQAAVEQSTEVDFKPVAAVRSEAVADGTFLDLFAPTQGSVGLRLVTGLLAATGTIIVAGSLLIRAAMGG